MKLIANKEIYYDRRMVQAEEEFDCDEKFVNVLLLAQAARKVGEPEHEGRRKTRGYKRRDMVAESP
jgi:hypothetical protein